MRKTSRRKKNPTKGARKVYRVAGEGLYRQRPVFYSRDGRLASKKLGKRSPRKKLNPRKGVYVMARKRRKVRRRRKSNPIKKLFARRRRTRRNPSGGMGVIFDTLLQGVISSGTMVAGLYAGKAVANMIAGGGTTAPDPAKKAQYRNASRAGLTILAAVLMPKFAPKFADAIVSGLMASTTLGFMNTAFGLNLGELAGESEPAGLLFGGPSSSFDMNSALQVGDTELFGVTDLDGVNDF
jgi:hypothetical protein